MNFRVIKEYVGLIIQTNLAHCCYHPGFQFLTVSLYYCQLSFFLIKKPNEEVLDVIQNITEFSLISPYFKDSDVIQLAIGIIFMLINAIPYLIILYRVQTKFMKHIESISKSLLDISSFIVHIYFQQFTWVLYIPQLYFSISNFLNSQNIVLLVLSSFILLFSFMTLYLSNIFFINLEFNERSMKKYFSYLNFIYQIQIIVIVFLNITQDLIVEQRVFQGFILFLQLYELFIQLPFGFSVHCTMYNFCTVTYTVLYLTTSFKEMIPLTPNQEIVILLIFTPLALFLTCQYIQYKREMIYQIKEKTQFQQLIQIENFFEISLQAQTSLAKYLEAIIKLSLHKQQCKQLLCYCRGFKSGKITKSNQVVIFISSQFKDIFEKNKSLKKSYDFETLSLKFLTFTNRYKRNGPKTYQELKILFQNKNVYSYYFTTMCQILQFILQNQMQRDEDFNINSEQQSRLSNVKLQKATRNDRSIVQNLYQMEQVKQHMLPLLIQISQFKSKFWKAFDNGKINNYFDLEIWLKQLQTLQKAITRIHQKYEKIFNVNGKSYNVQYLKFSGIMHLLLYNDVRKYYEIEKQCKDILIYEKSMNSYEITNINFFMGSAISLKLAIAIGPNIGTIRNKILSPSIPRFFGFDAFNNQMEAFLDFTKGNINTLMPDWIQPIHDEMMQNYIRRGFTHRIGKYFQTFIKLYDKTLARVQVYLAHNFSPDLQSDFTMIGCVKRLDEEYNKDKLQTQQSNLNKKKYFRGTQYILFDINGNILGITTGLFQMIKKFQRRISKKVESLRRLDGEADRVRRMSSQISTPPESESEHNINDIQWSNMELTIEDFYQQGLVWMILPFITKEIEATGMEFLLHGQRPTKEKYPNLVDLDVTNTIINNKETYFFIPEDMHLFFKQYNKVLTRMYEDEKSQSRSFSQASSRYKYHSDPQINTDPNENELFQIRKSVNLFNERLCFSFFEDHSKQNQVFNLYDNSNKDRVSTRQFHHSRSSLMNTDEEQSDSQNSQALFVDKMLAYASKFTLQDFNPIPIIYSINYEEYQYKKNESEQKVQMFVIEINLNESILVNIDQQYKKQLRETIKQTFQSQFKKKMEKQYTSQDSISPVCSFNELYDNVRLDHYNFQTHVSNIDIQEQSDQSEQSKNSIIYDQENPNVSEQAYTPIEVYNSDYKKASMNLMTKRSDYNELLISNNARNGNGNTNGNGNGNAPQYQMQDMKSVKSVKAIGQSIGSFKQLNLSEKDMAKKTFLKLKQKNKQIFYADAQSNYRKNLKGLTEKTDKKRDINIEKRLEIVSTLDGTYKSINNKVQNYKYPQFYKLQIYLVMFCIFLTVSFISLVSILVYQQYRYNNCLSTIDIMLEIQGSYSLITQGLFRRFYQDYSNSQLKESEQLIISDSLEQAYSYMIDEKITQFLSNLDQNQFILNSFDIINLVEDHNESRALFQFLTEIGSDFHQIQNTTEYTRIEEFASDLQQIGELPQIAEDLCFSQRQDIEYKYQTILLSYMVVTFSLVTILQLLQFPLIMKVIKYQKQILRQIVQVKKEQIYFEIECYEYFEKQLQVSIYEWMALDFIQKSGLLYFPDKSDYHSKETGALSELSSYQPLTLQNNNQIKFDKKNNRKINLTDFRQVKQIVILVIGLVTIMAYFLIIFIVIYLFSNEINSVAHLLFQQKQLQSNFITVLTSLDIVAFNQIQNQEILTNIIPLNTFNTYAQLIGSTDNDVYLQNQQELMNVLSNTDLTNRIKEINEINICSPLGIDCTTSGLAIYNKTFLEEFNYGIKFLISQVEKLIQIYPQFFVDENKNNTLQEFIEYISTQEHMLYVNFGSEIILNAYDMLVQLEILQFENTLQSYREALLIFLFTVGVVGLLIYGFLARISLRQQKMQLQICTTSIYLLSPSRYQSKEIQTLKKKI